MTHAMISASPAQRQLANYLANRERTPPPSLPVKIGRQSGLATTYIISRTDGGVGASTLALMLEFFHACRVNIIQVGGLKSWAYTVRSEDDFLHVVPHHDEDRVSPPLDARMKQPDCVTIIEYEHGMPREALTAATLLTENFEAHVVLCLIGSRSDPGFRLPDIARREGIEPLVLTQHGLPDHRDQQILKIPTVPKQFAEKLRIAPHAFALIMDGWNIPIAALMFEKRLQDFGKRLAEWMA